MRKLEIPGYTGAILIPRRPNFWKRLFGFRASPLTEELLITVTQSRNLVSREEQDRILEAFLSENVNSADTIPLAQSPMPGCYLECSIEELFIAFESICALQAKKQIAGVEDETWRDDNAIEQYICWCYLRSKILALGASAIGWISWRYISALYITIHRDECARQLYFVPIWRNGILLREMNYLFQQLGDQTAIPLIAHSAFYREPFRQEALRTIAAIIKKQPPQLHSSARDQAVNAWNNEQVQAYYADQLTRTSVNKCISDLDALLA